MLEIESKLMEQVNGSARVRLGNSDILVGVKMEIDTPFPDRPFEGKIEFFVDWYILKIFPKNISNTDNIYSLLTKINY